jgi:hypothetical protein
MDRTLRLDVWGGYHSMDHLARSHHAAEDDALWQRIRNELSGGYLVNLRLLGPGEGWGADLDFDERVSFVATVQ